MGGLISGEYRDEPITDKESSDESKDKLSCGISSMQGWRKSQEDAHNCILDYDTATQFFAVYDGHGGHEVAEYCSLHLPEFIKNTEEYKQRNYEEALKKAFLAFDATLKLPETIEELAKLSRPNDSKSDISETSEDEADITDLVEEADMPIEKVMEKYKNKAAKTSESDVENKSSEGTSCSSSSAGPSSSSAACSSFEPPSEDGVSSSSEVGTSEVKPHQPETSQAASLETNNVPDSSNPKEAEAVEDSDKKKENVDDSKQVLDAKQKIIENGTVSHKGKQKARITPQRIESALNTKPMPDAQQLYKTWLQMGEISDSEESSGDDDDDDQSFEAPHEESSEDDDEEGVNIAIEADDSNESSDTEKEEDDDEEEDEEGDEGNHNYPKKDKDNRRFYNTGCTALVALLVEQKLYVANAGDCRCVVSRNGKAIPMSFDHKPEHKIEKSRIYKAGGIVNDGRVDYGLNLSRAMGDHNLKLRDDLPDIKQKVIALPDIKTLTVTNDDEFMVLACDGIWNSMKNQEVIDFIRPRVKEGGKKLSEICEEMFDHCLAESQFNGLGCDNMTAIIVKFNSTAKRPSESLDDEVSVKKIKNDNNESESQIDTTTL